MKSGDPTLLGWLTVAAYLAAALSSAACAWQAARLYPGKQAWIHRLFWGSLSAALLFLGINKQLDLQSYLNQASREFAIRHGWYEMGQAVQTWLIAGMVVGTLVGMVVLVWTLPRFWQYYWPVLAGLLFLARFIIVRGASFWGVPLPQLSRWTGGLHVNWLLEILGASLICLSAWLFLRPRKMKPPSSGVYSTQARAR